MTALTVDWTQDQPVELESLGTEPVGIHEVPMAGSIDSVFALITASETMDLVADELEAVQALVSATEGAFSPGDSDTRTALTLTIRQARGLGACLGHMVHQLRAVAADVLAKSELAKAG